MREEVRQPLWGGFGGLQGEGRWEHPRGLRGDGTGAGVAGLTGCLLVVSQPPNAYLKPSCPSASGFLTRGEAGGWRRRWPLARSDVGSALAQVLSFPATITAPLSALLATPGLCRPLVVRWRDVSRLKKFLFFKI